MLSKHSVISLMIWSFSPPIGQRDQIGAQVPRLRQLLRLGVDVLLGRGFVLGDVVETPPERLQVIVEKVIRVALVLFDFMSFGNVIPAGDVAPPATSARGARSRAVQPRCHSEQHHGPLPWQ
jgi:hypothetical protein